MKAYLYQQEEEKIKKTDTKDLKKLGKKVYIVNHSPVPSRLKFLPGANNIKQYKKYQLVEIINQYNEQTENPIKAFKKVGYQFSLSYAGE